jgi:ABC-2 type transport system permease protein
MFSLVEFVAFFGPLVGLILGFDTINRERNEGTLSVVGAADLPRCGHQRQVPGRVFLIAVMLLSIVLVITGLGWS